MGDAFERREVDDGGAGNTQPGDTEIEAACVRDIHGPTAVREEGCGVAREEERQLSKTVSSTSGFGENCRTDTTVEVLAPPRT